MEPFRVPIERRFLNDARLDRFVRERGCEMAASRISGDADLFHTYQVEGPCEYPIDEQPYPGMVFFLVWVESID